MTDDIIKAIVEPRKRDIGGFDVRRAVPSAHAPMVGPFIFFDHIGPAVLPAGRGIDVRPHPHINLATVTYLFDGDLYHRDSTGASQNIEPGAVNWMTAGRGIAHSERSRDASRAIDQPIHGIQSWVALPTDAEECEPSFRHYPAADLPTWQHDGLRLRLVAGAAYERRSPVQTDSPLFYVDVDAQQAGTLAMPDGYAERALYVAAGAVTLAGTRYDEGRLLTLHEDVPATLAFAAGARVILFGGEPFPEPRLIWWNFVSSSAARIEQAKRDWQQGRFDAVPGESEFIPLPDDR